MKYFTIILLIGINYNTIAQNDYYKYTDPDDSVSITRYSLADNDYLPDEIIGFPYEKEEFQKGVLLENNQPIVDEIYFRYNIYENKIELKENLSDDNSKIAILKKSPNIIVKIKKEFIIFDEGSESYYKILFMGSNYKLYKKHIKKFYKAKRAKNSYDLDVLATFKDKVIYFLADKNGKLHEIPTSRKKKIKFFGNKKDDIKKYIDHNDLDINNEDVLIKVVRYFNSFNDASL